MKKLNRLSVAELKQLVNRPDVVEMHDVTARDPKLLVNLKVSLHLYNTNFLQKRNLDFNICQLYNF